MRPTDLPLPPLPANTPVPRTDLPPLPEVPLPPPVDIPLPPPEETPLPPPVDIPLPPLEEPPLPPPMDIPLPPPEETPLPPPMDIPLPPPAGIPPLPPLSGRPTVPRQKKQLPWLIPGTAVILAARQGQASIYTQKTKLWRNRRPGRKSMRSISEKTRQICLKKDPFCSKNRTMQESSTKANS